MNFEKRKHRKIKQLSWVKIEEPNNLGNSHGFREKITTIYREKVNSGKKEHKKISHTLANLAKKLN